MYMIPSRRAIAAVLPCSSGASSQLVSSATWVTWVGLAALTRQSQARPSLCSLAPAAVQARTMPESPVAG